VTLSPTELQPIYELIGGLPLALKLVAAQLGHLSLTSVLDNLRQAQRAPGNLCTSFISTPNFWTVRARIAARYVGHLARRRRYRRLRGLGGLSLGLSR
jgi:hypothetical protein